MKTTQGWFCCRALAQILGICFLSLPIWSQETPKYEVYGGFSYVRARSSSENETFNVQGGNVAGTYYVNQKFGITADVGGYHFNDLGAGIDGRLFTALFGPRYTYRRYTRFLPFAQTLAGFARHTASTSSVEAGENGFSMLMGAGLDIPLRHRIAIRPAEVDYLLTRFADASGEASTQSNLRISAGIVFRFGHL